jgi:sigma-B regulation protein RsbU (phosphoserine phosphatase)
VPSSPTLADACLLVVDDNEDNRYTLTRRLKREGYSRLLFASNGREALEVLRDHPVDLVLLDIMMPDMNGYEVLERMKADARLRDVPVVMISAVDEVESVVRCVELGAEDYLPKPFNASLLRARVGASLEKKRLRDEVRRHVERMEADLANARAIQLGMVPTEFPPSSAEFPVDIFGALHPAYEVGGDLYDFFLCDAHTLCVVVADVSGKGAAAALFMARAKALIRTVAKLLRRPGGGWAQPSEILGHVNADLCRDNPGSMFVTAFIAMLDLDKHSLTYCNAGHTSPYLVGPETGAIALTEGRGRALGFRPNALYSSAARAIHGTEALFAFTDGVTEAENAAGEFFETERLETVLRLTAGAVARRIVETVVSAVRQFAGDARQSDDIAALAVRLVGERADLSESEASAAPGQSVWSEEIELTICNRLDELPRVAAALDELVRRRKLPEAAFDLHVALDEILSNIVKYAFDDNLVHDIRLRLTVTPAMIEAVVEDDGCAFDPIQAQQQDPHTPIAGRIPGGLGVSVVKRLMSEVAYERVDGHNRISMKRRFDR